LAYSGTLRRPAILSATVLATVLILPPATAFGTSAPSIGQDSYAATQLLRAQTHEARGEWGQACELYGELLTLDRHHPDLKKSFLHCLRQCHRKYRTTDPSFLGPVLDRQFTPRDALNFYRDVLEKIQAYYHLSEKVQKEQTARLFQAGLDELCLDLADKDFCKTFLKPGLTEAELLHFRTQLRDRFSNVRIRDVADALEQVRAVARDTLKVELSAKIVAVEFACGACNALDEYSFYLTQGSLLELRGEKQFVKAEIPEKGIGYVQLSGFDDTTLPALDGVLQELRASKTEVLLLDLRGNAGGSLDVAVQVVERFLQAPAAIASTTGKVTRTFQSYSMSALEVPIFVLTDPGTASAAELVVGALKAHKRAEIVGQTTFGKNLIQKMVPVSQAPYGALQITWGQFHLPRTEDLSKHGGITPTIPTRPDEQLAAAMSRARALLGMR